eukprot:2503259-Rhodomonas_salina.1
MQPTAFRAPGERRGCDLVLLPSALLGSMWPAERVVAGLRVCRHIRQRLAEHAGNILMVKRMETDVSEDALVKDFGRVSLLKVAVKWRRQPPRLICIGSLGFALAHLDLSLNQIGAVGAGRLSGMLEVCKALGHLDLSHNKI